jgi:hypothetical protein
MNEIQEKKFENRKMTNDEIIKFLQSIGFNMDDELEDSKSSKIVTIFDFERIGWDSPY